jgi:hypothetical protein
LPDLSMPHLDVPILSLIWLPSDAALLGRNQRDAYFVHPTQHLGSIEATRLSKYDRITMLGGSCGISRTFPKSLRFSDTNQLINTLLP